MKRKLALLLIVVMAISLMSGCGGSKSKGTDKDDKATETLAALDTTKYVALGNYKGLTVNVEVEEITDEYVNTYITEYMLASFGKSTALSAEDTVQTGDDVTFTCIGKVDGEVFDGGSTEGDETWDVTIGSQMMIPGFEDGFIGMKIGETKDIKATFPEDYGKDELNGKEAVFTVKLVSAARTEYPTEITQEVLEYYEYEDEAALRTGVRELLEESALLAYEENFQTATITAVRETCHFIDTPQFLIDVFKKSQEEYYEYMASYYDMELKDFVEQVCAMTMEAYEDEINTIAKSYADQYVMYEAIADAEGIEITEEELDKYAEETAAEYQYDSIQTLYEDFGKEDFRDFVMVQKVMDFLMENTKNPHAPDVKAAE